MADNTVENVDPAQGTFHVMEIEAVAAHFQTDPKTGLSKEVAAQRFATDGPNELTEKKKRTIWEKIWDQLYNVLVIILIIVAIISAIKGATDIGKPGKEEDVTTSFIEVGLILLVIVLNTWIGIRQEGSAEKSAEALKAMLSSDATVIRDGQKIEVPARELVRGDLVVLSTGDRIPADLRLVRVANLASQEAALTGESVPVEKFTNAIASENPAQVPLGDRKNLAFSATLISQGEGLGIVVAAGDNTEIGTINSLVSTVEKKKTNVLLQIDMVSKVIAGFVCLTALVTFLVAFFYTGQAAMTAVNTALVTAVAMIPEGLAAIVTLTYAWAVSNMAKHNAIVRVLPAVETLGSVTVICSDKTGTLTMNLMSMVAFVTSNGRFRVDANATSRTASNFVRDDAYMQVGKKKSAPETVKESPEENISMQSVDVSVAGDASVKPSEPEAEGSSGVKNGDSPDVDFVRSLLATGVLCSHSELGKDGGREGEIGNPTEISIVRAAYFAGIDHNAVRASQPIINEVPFSSEYKFMATIHKSVQNVDNQTDGWVLHVKGAIDKLMPLVANQSRGGSVGPDAYEPVDRHYWLEQAEAMSSHGLRVLALCRTMIPADSISAEDKLDASFIIGRPEPFLTIVGLACILDPPRPECVDAIKEAHGAGVRVAMITGDHKATAIAIGGMLGIVDTKYPNAVTGPELDAMSDEELRICVMTHNVFARASPENKLRIVKALQAEKQVSSMTGDGVNDAPALKAADMGVAMGKEGTDVAREAAEMILADDNFSTIVKAVREGRVVWDNLRKVLLFNTPVNNAQGLTVLFGMICGLPYSPLTPIQVLYCNLICAVTLGFVLAVEPAEDGIMRLPPRRVGKRLIGRYLLFRIFFGTVVLVTFTVGAVFWVRGLGYDADITTGILPVPVNSTTCTGVFDPNYDDIFSVQNPSTVAFEFFNFTEGIPASAQTGQTGMCCPYALIYNKDDNEYVCPNEFGRNLVRSQASNTLTLSAISVMLSARFAYNSAFHTRLFFGNIYAWYSAAITLILQVCITYIPGLNNIVFNMGPMNGVQWGIAILFVICTFICMESEKAVMRIMKAKNFDTDDDREGDVIETHDEPTEPFVPQSSQRSATMHSNRLHR